MWWHDFAEGGERECFIRRQVEVLFHHTIKEKRMQLSTTGGLWYGMSTITWWGIKESGYINGIHLKSGVSSDVSLDDLTSSRCYQIKLGMSHNNQFLSPVPRN